VPEVAHRSPWLLLLCMLWATCHEYGGIKKKCFGGKSDAGHDKAIGDLQKGIAYLKRLEGTNCVSGHPMADR